MTTAGLARPTVTITEHLRDEAAQVIEHVGDEQIQGVTITTATGKQIDVPAGLAEVVDTILHRMAQGGQVTLQTMPELLTTSLAADLLGVSRPTVVKLINDGKLNAIMRGSHRRVRWAELSEFMKAREAERAAAITDLVMADFDGE
nr:helix-turn-helix domain-containing protein [Actinomycetota bacterium]